MALITRISRLFTADMHAMLDRIEEPEVLLKQAVRDMEAAVAATEQRLRALTLDTKRLTEAECAATETLAALERELDTCFAAGEENLARAVLKRKLSQARLAKRLAIEQAETNSRMAALDATLASQREQLEELRQKAALVIDQPGDSHRAWPAGATAVSADEVEVAFLAEKQRRAQS